MGPIHTKFLCLTLILSAVGCSSDDRAPEPAAPAAEGGRARSRDAGGGPTKTVPEPAAGTSAELQQPSECNGVALPPRALGPRSGPFEVGPEAAGLEAYWPTEGFRTLAPELLGFDPDKLASALEFTTQYSNTQAIFVVRHGYVAAETYLGNFSADSSHESFSMAKSFTSGLIGIAIEEGKLASTDAKICEFYPMHWDCADMQDKRSRITVEHSMNLMTGLQWHEDWRSTGMPPNDALNGNMLETVLSRPAVDEPGTVKRYSTGDPSLLSGVLQGATGQTAYAYAKEKLFDVIGIPNVRWGMDAQGRTSVYAGLQATAADFAKYGYLMLNRGNWDGQQVIPAAWIDRTTRGSQPCEDWNQYLWHVNLPLRLGQQDPGCAATGKSFCAPTEIANVPPDGFTAKGVNGQFIVIIPSADLVVVRLAADMRGSEHWDEYARGLVEGILDAMN